MTVSSASNLLCGPHRECLHQATRPRWVFTGLQGSIYPADGTETVRVHLICQLHWPQGAHTKPCFWTPLRGRFQKGWAFESVDSVDHLPQCVWASSHLRTTRIQEKVEGGGIHFFFRLTAGATSHFLCFSGLWTWDCLAFLGLQLADGRSRDFSSDLSSSLSLSPYIYLLLALYLWRTLTKTHIASLQKCTRETSAILAIQPPIFHDNYQTAYVLFYHLFHLSIFLLQFHYSWCLWIGPYEMHFR